MYLRTTCNPEKLVFNIGGVLVGVIASPDCRSTARVKHLSEVWMMKHQKVESKTTR